MVERSSTPGNRTKRRGKGPRDVNTLAYEIVQQATGQAEPEESTKNPAAVTLGRLGGLKGGKARAEKLSAERRREIAKKAAKVRWGTVNQHSHT
jgi:hypothetical protein